MSSLAEVLAWKFNLASGIRTREDGQGGMEIFDWPVAQLGSKPTAAQIVQWTADFAVLPPPIDPHAELVAAIANAIKDEPPGSPVRKLGEALLGQTSAGRVAGRPV